MRKLLLALVVALTPFIAGAEGMNTSSIPYTNQEMTCLAKNIYYEARGEGLDGQEYVAWVTLNRAEHDGYPSRLCDVVYDSGQFSWTKHPYPIEEADAWQYAQDVARYVVMEKQNHRVDPTNGAIMFHAKHSSPYWKSAYERTASVGNHIFYK